MSLTQREAHPFALEALLAAVRAERERQDKTWGELHLPDGVGPAELPLLSFDALWHADQIAVEAHDWAAAAHDERPGSSWLQVLTSDYADVAAAATLEHLRRALIRIAAGALQWAEALDERERAATTLWIDGSVSPPR